MQYAPKKTTARNHRMARAVGLKQINIAYS